MGDRGNIAIKYQEGQKIYFYSHWGGSELAQTLKRALEHGRSRWDDESYLARIIFSEMIKDEIDGTTGYGIAPFEIEKGSPLFTVDTKEKTVNDVPFDQFIDSVKADAYA